MASGQAMSPISLASRFQPSALCAKRPAIGLMREARNKRPGACLKPACSFARAERESPRCVEASALGDRLISFLRRREETRSRGLVSVIHARAGMKRVERPLNRAINMHRALKRMLAGVAPIAAATAFALAPAAHAQTQTFTFNIEKQPLSSALLAFGRRADLSVLAPSALIDGKIAPEVRGQLSASAALDKLLEGTGLSYAYVQTNAVKIFQKDQAEISPDRSPSEDGSAKPEQVTITGSNIKGVPYVASPIETYTAGEMARSGATTTEQFVRKLPQNTSSLTQFAPGSLTTGTNFDAVTGVDLRGLGIDHAYIDQRTP